jgi:uncharacterized membrane protein
MLNASQLTVFHMRRYGELGEKQFGKLPPRRVSEMFGDRLLDSGIAGFLAGGAVNAYARDSECLITGCPRSDADH